MGFHLARELKNRGYEIILISKNVERLREAARKLDAIYYAIDLSKDYEKIGKIIKEFRPKVIINNAGFGIYGDIKNQDWRKLKDMLNVNIMALTYITKVAIEHSTGDIFLTSLRWPLVEPKKSLGYMLLQRLMWPISPDA